MNKEYVNKAVILIAEFLGAKGKIVLTSTVMYEFPNGKMYKACSLKYHKRWELLMPVVEKISRLTFKDGDKASFRTFGMINESGEFMVRINRCSLHCSKSFIEAVFVAVVEFIEYYNLTKEDYVIED